ncbi:barstar family protein [Dactylosporangium sp. AC04546]|uniref:barstar family protein n=1 Tax=Dactylosporangium sp. AC04546 TaxID=2862460 RepID=UPI001EDF2E5F|nr:barstar family protein [Dactylosporangium sp. AC04546]WVK88619.1 barstar family protein [Dactylosporangium sp. AC04546]
MGLPVLVIDGADFSDFDGFAREFSKLLAGHTWRGNLDAFNDILSGGFGTPDNGFVLRWRHADRSRAALGYEATIARLEGLLRTAHPSNHPAIRARIERARLSTGPTLFDELVDIIRDHADTIALELA